MSDLLESGIAILACTPRFHLNAMTGAADYEPVSS